MPLSEAAVDAHIETWSARLAASGYPYRGKWPSRLFHHAPLENIAAILNSQQLLSRDHSADLRPLDVADPAVIANRTEAHAFGRMYFRPRTPTQFHIEGIRKPSEYYHGTKHCPTIGVLIFDAKTVLTLPNVQFTTANMQSYGTQRGDSDDFFENIDFASVYHEGWFQPQEKATIISRRCAEVLVPSPLQLNEGGLQWIYCRSQAERTHLLELLTEPARAWSERIRVSDDIRVFEKRYTYVQNVSISNDGIIFSLAPRTDGRTVEISIIVRDAASGVVILNSQTITLNPIPPNGKQNWIYSHQMAEGLYQVEITLEGCKAFAATILHENIPF